MLPYIEHLDAVILLWLQSLRGPLDSVVIGISRMADNGYVWILAALILLLIRRTRSAGAATLLALAGNLLLTNVCIKNAVARIRPYEMIAGLTSLIGPLHDWSFPSGHASASFAAATAMAFLLGKRFGIPAFLLAALISLSRLYLGVHYPSDVLAGAAVGFIAGLLASLLVKAVCRKRSEKEQKQAEYMQ